MTDERRRGDLSDGEILTRLDTISGEVHAIRDDMARWRSEFVADLVYQADERTRAEVRRQLEAKDDEQGNEIANLQAEASRRAREKRGMWTAITVAIAGALIAGIFGWAGRGEPSVVVCVPTQQVACR